MIFYFPNSNAGASEWTREDKTSPTRQILYPNNFANTNVVIGDNDDTVGGLPLKFKVIQNRAAIALYDDGIIDFVALNIDLSASQTFSIAVNSNECIMIYTDTIALQTNEVKADSAGVLLKADLNKGQANQTSGLIDIKHDQINIQVANLAGSNFQVNILENKINFNTVLAYDDDAAAGLAGLVPGDIYQTTGAGAAPLNVAGIMMLKQ
jgi:hypothetical protein